MEYTTTTTTTNYYNVLGLVVGPSTGFSRQTLSSAEVRRAYKLALLAAHPDKKNTNTNTNNKNNSSIVRDKREVRGGAGSEGYTIDQVKTAYMILSNEKSKREYDTWLLGHSQQVPGSALSSSVGVEEGRRGEDFVLGLEVLDLADFDMIEGEVGEVKAEWTRPCRCGADKGFRIREEELEDAAGNGEKEVLVGCEGCSLWVRVGFDVEVEEG